MKYAMLLRGINVGGRNKVTMAELRSQTEDLGYASVQTYINSGNLFFETEEDYASVHAAMRRLFANHYPFVTCFSLFTRADYEADCQDLPAWWHSDLARKDVLFYTDKTDKCHAENRIRAMALGDEVIHFGKLGVYWGKYSEAEFLKTAYHKYLIKEDFYKQVTIRNGKTFAKLEAYLV